MQTEGSFIHPKHDILFTDSVCHLIQVGRTDLDYLCNLSLSQHSIYKQMWQKLFYLFVAICTALPLMSNNTEFKEVTVWFFSFAFSALHFTNRQIEFKVNDCGTSVGMWVEETQIRANTTSGLFSTLILLIWIELIWIFKQISKIS